MPIEVRELIIKATVSQDANAGGNPGGGSAGSASTQDIIKTCVDKVLEIIQEKHGR